MRDTLCFIFYIGLFFIYWQKRSHVERYVKFHILHWPFFSCKKPLACGVIWVCLLTCSLLTSFFFLGSTFSHSTTLVLLLLSNPFKHTFPTNFFKSSFSDWRENWYMWPHFYKSSIYLSFYIHKKREKNMHDVNYTLSF